MLVRTLQLLCPASATEQAAIRRRDRSDTACEIGHVRASCRSFSVHETSPEIDFQGLLREIFGGGGGI